MESLQRRDMVRINIAALYMPANRRATPRGLDDANWHIGVLGAQLHGELLSQIAEVQ